MRCKPFSHATEIEETVLLNVTTHTHHENEQRRMFLFLLSVACPPVATGKVMAAVFSTEKCLKLD